MSITPDKAPETMLASDPNALFLKRTDEINELLDSGASLSGHERNCFFLNTGDGKFATASGSSGFDFYDDARAVARSDWDQDGDIDLWFSNRTAPRLRFLRNNASRDAHFVAIRLQGSTSNRDAIGARVELKSGGRTLLRGLRAGEGFLGQSSKWLHFGLGAASDIGPLVVHWPGGKAESFTGLAADGFFILRQGAGAAIRQPMPARAVKLAEKPFALPDSSEQAAVRLCSRMPIPELSQAVAPQPGRALFVSLWASWCPACVSEFKEFAAHEADITAAGIDVLALSVNGIGEGDNTTFAQAETALRKLGVRAASHRPADAATLEQLRIIANRVVAQNGPLPLPSGFLIDADGRLAAFYRGPAAVDRLLEDAASLELSDPAAIFRAGLPFAGTWIGGVRSHPIDRLANEFIDAGFIDSGLAFAKANANAFPNPEAYANVFSRVGNRFAERGELDTAIRYYRDALSRDDASASIQFNLALALERKGELPEALEAYRRAIALDPTITVAHLNRGAILARSNHKAELDSGIDSLREAVRLNPNLAASHYHLGLALERSGEFANAFTHYQQAALLAPDHLGNAMQLAHLLERAGKLENALTEYDRIRAIYPDSPQPAFQAGAVNEKLGSPQAAADAYRACLAQNPRFVPALNNLAWLLATTKQGGLRAPDEALKLATLAAEVTEFKQAAILDTLATAQFNAGDQASAIATLKLAIPLARNSNQATFAIELEEKLQKYQSRGR